MTITVVELEATAAYPYRHGERATAALRAELRHRAADQGQTPDWDTFEVTGPVAVPDALGRLWHEYRATVQVSDR